MTDTNISQILEIPRRTLSDWKKADGWRLKVYNFIKEHLSDENDKNYMNDIQLQLVYSAAARKHIFSTQKNLELCIKVLKPIFDENKDLFIHYNDCHNTSLFLEKKEKLLNLLEKEDETVKEIVLKSDCIDYLVLLNTTK